MPDLRPVERRALTNVIEHNSRYIAREWNREIEADIRRLAARRDDGKWKILVWTVLELIWLVAVFGILGLFSQLR